MKRWYIIVTPDWATKNNGTTRGLCSVNVCTTVQGALAVSIGTADIFPDLFPPEAVAGFTFQYLEAADFVQPEVNSPV